jgi:hypothetical protein
MNWCFCNERISVFIEFCYQGIMSTIEALILNDVIVYDVDAHVISLMVSCL